MNKKIVTLAALLSLGLAACGPTKSTSSSSPVDTGDTGDSTSEVKPQTTYTAVTINNKDDMQDPWYMPGAPMREMSITAKISDTENGNVMQMISDGVMTITSSDPTVASIMGINVKPLKAGKTTITVTVKNPSGTISDSMELDILADTFATGAPKVVDPEAGKEYRLGALSTYFNYWVYATGAMSSYYLGTNTNFAQAMLVEPEQVKDDKGTVVANQWYLKISATPDVSNKGMYLAAIKDGNYVNPKIATPDQKSIWTYDVDEKTFATAVGGKNYYLGADDDNKTLNVVSENDIDGGFYFKASLLEWDENGTAPTITAPKIDAGEAIEIATLADQKEEDRDYKKLYRVTGILEDKDPTDAYANAYLTDPKTGKSLQIYGMAESRDAIVADGEAIIFTNPQHGTVAPIKDIPNGAEVTLDIVRCVGYSNYTAVIVDYETAVKDAEYDVNLATPTNGTATLDKTKAAYGDTITITATPNDGFEVDNVSIKNAYGTVTATKGEDGKYTFPATCVNNVSVFFKVKDTTDYTKGAATAVAPEEGKFFKFGLYQQKLEKNLYLTGAMDGFYFETTEDFKEAAYVTAEANGTNWNLKLVSGKADGNNKYIAGVVSGTHNNIVFQDDAFAWTWDADGKYFHASIADGTDVYIGNYGTFDTLSLSTLDHLTGADTNLASLYIWDESIKTDVESINLTASKTSAYVGEKVTLTATLAPETAIGDVAYSVTSGGEFGTLAGNVLTITAAGTIKVQATSGSVKSNEVTITALDDGLVRTTYTFAEMEKGTQYVGETRQLNDTLKMTTNNRTHITDELRLYAPSGDSASGNAIFESTVAIKKMVINAGNNPDTLVVETSTDGTAYTTAQSITTTKNYTDYEVELTADNVKFVRISSTAKQIRIPYITFATVKAA